MITYKGYTGVFEYDPDIGAFAGWVVDTCDRINLPAEVVLALRTLDLDADGAPSDRMSDVIPPLDST